jgi:threonine dehydratase
MASVTLQDIQAAARRIAGAVYRSPMPASMQLSRLCGAEIYCKLDHLQMTGSFKERGARNKLLLLTEQQKRHGVICASAGNHAQALAYHGRELKLPVTVCMPKYAPLVKVENCRQLGAEVVLVGDTFLAAKEEAMERSRRTGQTYVHGFDDPAIIAGAGTMGLEILEDLPDVDAVIVPVGGAGLIAGVGTAIKALKPSVRIIGVEPIACPSLDASLRAGKVVQVASRPSLADGLAVAEVGQLCLEICKSVVDEVILVDEPDIARSVLKLLELEKTVVEGAGAVPLAVAMKSADYGLTGKKVVLCLCGGNIDMTMINRIIDRGLAVEGRLMRITCRTADRPGSLAKLTAVLAESGANVVEVFHDRHFGPADVAQVAITCIAETRDREHIRQIQRDVRARGIEVAPETDGETSQTAI